MVKRLALIWACGAAVLGAGVVLGQESAATAPATAGAVDADVMRTLEALQARDKTLRDFVAGFKKQDTNVRLKETEIRYGTVSYAKAGGKEEAKFAIHFDKLRLEDVPPQALDQDIVFDGRWLIDRNNKEKILRKTDLGQGGAVNPFKLGAGPLPIPIGQDPAEIVRDFTVTKEAAGAEDPKAGEGGTITHLKLVPKVQDKYNFRQADLWVDSAVALPVKVALVQRDNNLTAVTLGDLKINQGAAKVFDVPMPAAGTGWNVIVERAPAGPGEK